MFTATRPLFSAIKSVSTSAARLANSTHAAISAALIVLFGVSGGTSDYLPATDDGFDTWQVNFNALVQSDPTRYGLNAAAASDLLPLSTGYTAALIAAVDPITRTPVTVAAKNAAKAGLKSYVRSLVNIIQATLSVSNADKASLGVTIRNTVPTPIPTPTTYPIISAGASGPQLVTLDYRDQLTPLSKAKPSGAIALLLWVKASATPVADPTDGGEVHLLTKTPHQLTFDIADAGKTAYMRGRWVTRTDLRGPLSSVAQAGIAA